MTVGNGRIGATLVNRWPDDAVFSDEFRHIVGSVLHGGGNIRECFAVSDLIRAGDRVGWFSEWHRVAEANARDAEIIRTTGCHVTAGAKWLRASNYYRFAE